MNFQEICLPCKTGHHDECENFWLDALGENVATDICCCGEKYEPAAEIKSFIFGDEEEKPVKAKKLDAAPALEGWGTPELLPNGKARGDSGYIDPLAWPSSQNIGSLRDPLSTGRKRVAEMYPIPKGKTCEWAGLAAAGGGAHPIIGCVGYPATDLHHGPDKNTLNNMRASAGTSTGAQNVHQICSFCHNAWHTANDPDYPKRDYVEDQDQPWLPNGQVYDHDPDTMASKEDIYRVDAERTPGGRKDWTDDGPDWAGLDTDDE